MSEDKKEHPLKELVIKLNDRNIQRQRESGLTKYTVYGVIIYILFYLIKDFPSFFEQACRVDNFVVTAIFTNLSWCLCYFIATFCKKGTGNNRIFPKEDFFNLDVSAIPVVVSSFIAAWFNFFAYTRSLSGSSIFLMFGILQILNGLFIIVIFLYEKFRKVKNTLKIPSFIELNRDFMKFMEAFFFIVGVIFLGLAFKLMLMEKVDIDNDKISNVLLFDLCALGLFIAFFILFEMGEKNHIHDQLEELEASIYLNNLSNADIKNQLEEEYFGQDLKTWVIAWQKKINEYFSQLKANLETIQNTLPGIQNQDTDLIERQQLYLNQFDFRQRVINELQEYNRDFFSMIRNMQRFASIEFDDRIRINMLEMDYNNKIEEINVIDKELFTFFDEVQTERASIGVRPHRIKKRFFFFRKS